MKLNVNNPEFLLDTLRQDVINRTHYLVTQGIAYDANWRDAFVELFELIAQLETQAGPLGDKLTEDNKEVLRAVLNETKHIQQTLEADYPVGAKLTIGKGKSIWTVEGYHNGLVQLIREGKGRNKMVVNPSTTKITML